jgi:hypothetical protein
LSAIQQEGDAAKVGQLFNQIPGAADLAQKHAVVVGSGGGVLGSLSGLASSVVGKDAGVLVAAIGQLEETNLTMDQIKKIGTALLSYLKKSANPALAKEVVDSATFEFRSLGNDTGVCRARQANVRLVKAHFILAKGVSALGHLWTLSGAPFDVCFPPNGRFMNARPGLGIEVLGKLGLPKV